MFVFHVETRDIGLKGWNLRGIPFVLIARLPLKHEMPFNYSSCNTSHGVYSICECLGGKLIHVMKVNRPLDVRWESLTGGTIARPPGPRLVYSVGPERW